MGIDHDTAHFAVNSIRSWWQKMGRSVYGGASQLLITADAGGSNGPKTRLWKAELQKFANRTGLSITVCHYPPGTSKWKQDRTSALLPHRHELAQQSVDESGRDRQSHRLDDDNNPGCASDPKSTSAPTPKASPSAMNKWLRSI